jgi:CRP-like cAMP-binding protein
MHTAARSSRCREEAAVPDVWCDRGAVVAAAGEPDDRLLVVRDGLLGLQVERRGATQPHWLALLGPGGTAGETALLQHPEPRALTVVALVPSRLVEIRVEELGEADRLSLLPVAVELLAAQVRDREDRATYLRTASAPRRVAACLCDLVRFAGRPQGPHLVTLERGVLTQQEMGQYVGCARDAVNKSLATFVRSGWIELSARHIHVLDLPALRSFSDGPVSGRPALGERLLRMVDDRPLRALAG